MKLRHRFMGFAAFAAALLPAIASAVPVLPDAFYLAALQTSQHAQQEFLAPGTYTLDGASTTVDGTPSLAGHVSTAASDEFASVESVIHYAFAVSGPVNGIAVPMFVALSVDASVGGALLPYSRAAAHINVEHQFGSFAILQAHVTASSLNPHPGRVSVTLPFTAIAGEVKGIWMQIDVGTRGAGAIADAFADPYLFVDPAFLASHPGYSVIVSPGIGNTAPVPEPGTTLLLGSGLVALLAGRYRCSVDKRPLRRTPYAFRNWPGISLDRMPMGHRRFGGER